MSDMAILTKPSLIQAPYRLSGLVAGDVLDPGSPCYIYSDGTVLMSQSSGYGTGTFDGICVKGAVEGEHVTLMGLDAIITLADEVLAIGDFYYLSDSEGKLSTEAVAVGEMPIVKVVSASAVRVIRVN
jgi:hypothetical protein